MPLKSPPTYRRFGDTAQLTFTHEGELTPEEELFLLEMEQDGFVISKIVNKSTTVWLVSQEEVVRHRV